MANIVYDNNALTFDLIRFIVRYPSIEIINGNYTTVRATRMRSRSFPPHALQAAQDFIDQWSKENRIAETLSTLEVVGSLYRPCLQAIVRAKCGELVRLNLHCNAEAGAAAI